VGTGILFNFISIVLNRVAGANKNTTTHWADGNLLLTQALKMKMPQSQNTDDVKPDISESFLKHMQETSELLDNTYAKSLLKQAIKQIRESNKKDVV
jgi:hypothetical protein